MIQRKDSLKGSGGTVGLAMALIEVEAKTISKKPRQCSGGAWLGDSAPQIDRNRVFDFLVDRPSERHRKLTAADLHKPLHGNELVTVECSRSVAREGRFGQLTSTKVN